MQTPSPYKIITWKDTESTGAIGWIVIHNLANQISGGGLFIHETASLQEVKDLAYTMSLKNALQQPVFGGGKGGICFDPKDPRAPGVLKRFLQDNIEVIENQWCTGGDINTTTQAITQSITEVSNIQSPFKCLANMLQTTLNIPVCISQFHRSLACVENEFFTIAEAITGYSVFKTLEHETANLKPKIVVQGFGKVGKAFCYYAQRHYDIVGICERDWFLYDPNGIDVMQLLTTDLPQTLTTQREASESVENFLAKFLTQARADIFTPCATRYVITSQILEILITQTFTESKLKTPLIIAGANDVFHCKTLVATAFQHSIVVIPEWLSNAGSALLFMEALKYPQVDAHWNVFIKEIITQRITSFMASAKRIAAECKINFYEACSDLAHFYLSPCGESKARGAKPRHT